MSEKVWGISCAALLIFLPAAHCQSKDSLAPKAQPAAIALSEAILARLPTNYRDEGRLLVTAARQDQQRWMKFSDEDLTAAVIDRLSRMPAAATFLLTALEEEGSPKLRLALVNSLRPYWRSHLDSLQPLEHHAATDPDAEVSLLTLELLRSLRMDALGKLLESRVAMAKSTRDKAALAKLAPEQEHWFSLEQEIMLPAFLREPPVLFMVEPPDKSIRAVAFGDFGTGSIAQKQTAAAILEYSKGHPFDFGLTLGDNFYPYGIVSPSDPRWETQWEELYGTLGIKFYATLGNHDWFGFKDSPAAEILYTNKSPHWRLPAPYYTYVAGSVQFFAFDTVELNEAELEWLEAELSKSIAPWKVVYGHYPIYSAGVYYPGYADLVQKLLPILEKWHVDIYLNGHDHNLQELKPEGGVHFFVSGGGGAGLYSVNPYDRSVYQQRVNGFTVLEADATHFTVKFIGTDGKDLHSATLTK